MGAAEILAGIAADDQAAAEAASSVTKQADKVRQSAVDAKTATELGRTEDAQVAVEELNIALRACEEEYKTAVQRRKDR